jgi:geranylgeranyl reductase family protein
MPVNSEYDLIIVGAGPSGATAALYAKIHGLKTLLLDKQKFPRDKICGDALSGKSVGILRDLELLDEVQNLPGAFIQSVTFSSPAHEMFNIDLTQTSLKKVPKGFVIRREIFDDFMFSKAKKAADTAIENFTVTDIITENGKVIGVKGKNDSSENNLEFHGKIVIGADGYNSIVARTLGLYEHDPKHWVVALRCYYKDVKGLTDQIELHYVDEVVPGYFWIFPLEENYANVGIGMLHQYIKQNNVDLKTALDKAINSNYFKERFINATPAEKPVGWNLPVGSKKRKNYGNGFMLLGDAAGLIDPFTGEGIGNAMYSARIAVETAKDAIKKKDVSEKTLFYYYERLWNAIGNELKISHKLQKIGKYRFLLNFVIKKAARNKNVSDIIAGMLANEIPRKQLANPLFYIKLLFN